MNNKFVQKMLAGATLYMATAVKAEIDVDCFVVGRLRGDQSFDNPLESDLPKLLQGYQTSLDLYSLTVYSTDRGTDNIGNYVDRLDALELTLVDFSKNTKYPMSLIGSKGPASNVENFSLYEPLERIDILYNTDTVCNIKFIDQDDVELMDNMTGDPWDAYDEDWMEGDDLADMYSPYAIKNDYCIEGSPGVEIMTIYLDDLLPIAGMHGRSNKDGPGLESFNFIWFDDERDKCVQQASNGRDVSRDIMTPVEAEGLITDDMKRENLYVEDMLVEIDARYMEEDMLEKMIMADLNIDQNDKRQEILDDLRNEARDHKIDPNTDPSELLDIVYTLLDHEEQAEKERDQLMHEQYEFIEDWKIFQEEFIKERIAEASLIQMVEELKSHGTEQGDALAEVIEQQMLDAHNTGLKLEKLHDIVREKSDYPKNELTVEVLDQELIKVLWACTLVLVVGIIAGCCILYWIQQCMTKNKKPTEPNLPVAAVTSAVAKSTAAQRQESDPIGSARQGGQVPMTERDVRDGQKYVIEDADQMRTAEIQVRS